MRLSQWTAAKQLLRHPDLTPVDYARVQRMLDDGALFAEGRLIVAFLEEDGRWWSAVVKPTANGELYLVTYHRREERQVRRAERRSDRSGASVYCCRCPSQSAFQAPRRPAGMFRTPGCLSPNR